MCFAASVILWSRYDIEIFPSHKFIGGGLRCDRNRLRHRARLYNNIETQELFAQAAFWSREYELNPGDLESAIKLSAAVRKLGNPQRAIRICSRPYCRRTCPRCHTATGRSPSDGAGLCETMVLKRRGA